MSLVAGENFADYLGTPVTFIVPTNGIVSAYVYGAAGKSGGGGGYITGKFNVTSGQTIYVNVGGKGNTSVGGYNGGGEAAFGGGGGGFSSVGFDDPDIPLPTYLLIAGGGGGGSGVGGGGGISGGEGEGAGDGGGGGISGGSAGTDGTAGLQYQGGDGIGIESSGGGGGYWGGGGGATSGGGGSSYYDIQIIGPVTPAATQDGTSSGVNEPGWIAGIGDATEGSGNGRVMLFYTENIVCFLKGTLVQTPSGDVPIEHITKHSYVNNQYGEPVKVIYTTTSTFSYASHTDMMYKIPMGALGNTTDLYVTKKHPFFINGERKEARNLGFSVAPEAEVVDENGNVTVYNISIVDGNTKNLILVNGACEIGTGESRKKLKNLIAVQSNGRCGQHVAGSEIAV